MKYALVLGAGGFIGNHLVNSLKEEGFWVRGVDLRYPKFNKTVADDFVIGDLQDTEFYSTVIKAPHQVSFKDKGFAELYQLAADMGGAGYVFTGDNDANIMLTSARINLNTAELCCKYNVEKVFFSSSACMYPAHNQIDPDNPNCEESSAYPANPDSEYGWEKIFSERLYLATRKNYNLNVSIGRYHNIYGPLSTYEGGKEKSPAALCRKICRAKDDEYIEIWGNGNQTRSFLYIDDAIAATKKLIRDSKFYGPVNIGSEEMVSINDLCKLIIAHSGKNLSLRHIDGPTGVNGRTSHNELVKKTLDWQPTISLAQGIPLLYDWIQSEE